MDRSALDWLALVATAPVGRLATLRTHADTTADAEGGARDAVVDVHLDLRVDLQIDLVPFVFAWLDDPAPYGRLVHAVDHKPKRSQRLQRLRNVANHPEVTVLVDHYDHADWSRLWWVRLRGHASVLDPGGDRAGLAALVAKYAPYRERPPTGPMMSIRIDEVQGWSAGPSGVTVPDPDGGRR